MSQTCSRAQFRSSSHHCSFTLPNDLLRDEEVQSFAPLIETLNCNIEMRQTSNMELQRLICVQDGLHVRRSHTRVDACTHTRTQTVLEQTERQDSNNEAALSRSASCPCKPALCARRLALSSRSRRTSSSREVTSDDSATSELNDFSCVNWSVACNECAISQAHLTSKRTL